MKLAARPEQSTAEVANATEALSRIEVICKGVSYETPAVVTLPLGGARRVFPVYMGNM